MAAIKFLLLFLVAFSFLNAKTYSLEELFESASKNAKILKIKDLEAQIESKNVEGAKAGYYPTLGAVYNAEYTESLDGVPLGTEYVGGITISNGTRYQSSLALQLNYDLYHWGATDYQVEVAKGEERIKKIEWCTQEQDLHQRILDAYAEARKAALEKEYKIKMLNIHKKLYEVKERLYDAGQFSKVDLGDEAIATIELQQEVENTRIRYQDALSKIAQDSYVSIDKDTSLLPLVIKKKAINNVSFNETAQAQQLKRKIKQKKDEITMHQRSQLPGFALYSNYYLYASDPTQYDSTLAHLQKKSWNVGFALRYNIFNGFKDSSQSERLELEMLHLQQEYEDAKHSYDIQTDAKSFKLQELSTIQLHEKKLLDENAKKIKMIERLRKEQKVDLITQLNSEYELLQRTLNIELHQIDTAYETISLRILERGMKECTQH
jgi:outer membrane protein TolC